MSLLELFIVSIGLSMDAFAMSICKGLSIRRCEVKHMLLCGVYFGVFQALMPLFGYLLGTQFESLIITVAPYIAFILLAFIGINMIRESRQKSENIGDDFSPRSMLPLAVATSIDALAVGVSFALLNVDIIPAVTLIGFTTFFTCVLGVKIGNLFGNRHRACSECLGGLILVALGIKILLEHMIG